MKITNSNGSYQQHKIQSLEQSLTFLQEQHTSTLKGLHEEISKLQKKCSTLINELSRSGVNVERTEKIADSSLKDKLNEYRAEHSKLVKTIESKDERIRMLELQLKSKDQKYINDLKHYQLKATELQTEIEHKAASITYLTAKLQQNHVKDTILMNESVTTGSVLVPSPPKGAPNRLHERKNIRCVVSSPAANVAGFVLESTAPSYVLQNPSVKSNGRFSMRQKPSTDSIGRLSQTPRREPDVILLSKPRPSDYEDFIKMNQSEETITKQVIEPLPPIASTRGKTFSKRKNRTSSSGKVETLIVEPSLASPDRPVRTLQDLS